MEEQGEGNWVKKYTDEQFQAEIKKLVEGFGGNHHAEFMTFRSEYLTTKEFTDGLNMGDTRIGQEMVSREHGQGWRDSLKAEAAAHTERLVNEALSSGRRSSIAPGTGYTRRDGASNGSDWH